MVFLCYAKKHLSGYKSFFSNCSYIEFKFMSNQVQDKLKEHCSFIITNDTIVHFVKIKDEAFYSVKNENNNITIIRRTPFN